MKPTEPSNSRSHQSVSQYTAHNTHDLTVGTLFPLVDHVTQHTDLPSILAFIRLVFFTAQILILSLWVPRATLIRGPQFLDDLRVWMSYIVCWSPGSLPPDDCLLYFIVHTAVFAVILIFAFAVVLAFNKTRRPVKALMFILRLLTELAPSLLLFSLIKFATQSCKNGLNGDSISWIYFLIGSLEFVGYLIFFYFANAFCGSSPFLPSHFWAAFDIGPYVRHYIIMSLFFYLSSIVFALAEWLDLACLGCHAICGLLQIRAFCFEPFIAQWMNVFFLAVSIHQVVMDCANLVFRGVGIASGVGFLIILCISPVVSGVSAFLFMRWHEKHFMQRFQEPVQLATEDDYADLDLHRSPSHALFYLNFGIRNLIARFYDFRFINHLVNLYPGPEVGCQCLRCLAWFPGETQSLNMLSTSALGRPDLSARERFVRFQIERIRLLRESSASATAADKLQTMRQSSIEMISRMQSFWDRSECSISLLYRLSRQLNSVSSSWEEAVSDFPNSVPFRDVYITYLIEGPARFSDSVFQKSRLDMIETGVNFRVDGCFRCFIARFPEFLKRGVLDKHGRLMDHGHGRLQDSASGSAHGQDHGLSDDVEAEVGRVLLSQPHLRLTVEHAFEDRRANTHAAILGAAVFVTLASLAFAFSVYFAFLSYFDERSIVSDRVQLGAEARAYFFSAMLSWVYYWGMNANISVVKYPADFIDSLIAEDTAWEKEHAWFVDPNGGKDLAEAALYLNEFGRQRYSEMTEAIAVLAREGTNLTKYAGPLFSETMPTQICTDQENGADPIRTMYNNARTSWAYGFIVTSTMFEQPHLNLWFNKSQSMCIAMRSFCRWVYPLRDLQLALAGLASGEAEDAEVLLSPLTIALPIGFFGVITIVWLIVSVKLVRELNYFTRLLLSLPRNVRRETMKPLRKDATIDDDSPSQSGQSSPGFSLPILFNIAVLTLFAGTAGLLCGQISAIHSYNQMCAYLGIWVVNALTRIQDGIEATLGVILAVISFSPYMDRPPFNGEDSRYILLNDALETTTDSIDSVVQSNRGILEAHGGTPTSTGIDADLDALLVQERCETDPLADTYHKTYRCVSGVQLSQFLYDTSTDVLMAPSSYGGVITGGKVGEIFHLLDRHFIPVGVAINDAFRRLEVTFYSDYLSSHGMFFGVAFVLIFIQIVVMSFYVSIMDSCYQVLISLVRRVSPFHILASDRLAQYLLNKTAQQELTGTSPQERVIHNSSNCIICLSQNVAVELINPSVTRVFGYTPEQVLGLPLMTLMTPEAAEKIEAQIKLMADRHSAPLYEGHTVCLSDDGTEIPCSISILALFSNDEVSSFVAILKDETALLAQQHEAEAAKQQSETLLYQILPRNIVTRISSGEKDISFTIPSATIMFIDIVKFSDYAATLTPQEIMGNLSLIFSGFDEKIAAYERLLKIKLIGDVYMSAGGLFDPEQPPNTHAEQMIRFGLDALKMIEEVNVKLASALSVRIGVNSGGPILAGILGTDKPTFDIIGDPINIAARLQSTDLPGYIQISEDTRTLVVDFDFTMAPRGEVTLKGKGKHKTYLVEP